MLALYHHALRLLKQTYRHSPHPLLPPEVVEAAPSSSINPFDPTGTSHAISAMVLYTPGRTYGLCGREDGRRGGIRLSP